MAVSMHGLDLSFLRTPENQDRIRWMKNRLAEEKRDIAYGSKRSDLPAPQIMGDLNSAYPEGGFKSPVDGSFITSRRQLRDHNKAHGVRQCGEINPREWCDHITNEHKKRLAEPTPGVTFEWSKSWLGE